MRRLLRHLLWFALLAGTAGAAQSLPDWSQNTTNFTPGLQFLRMGRIAGRAAPAIGPHNNDTHSVAGGVGEITTWTAHNLVVGTVFTITGCSNPDLNNQTFVVSSVVSTVDFRFTAIGASPEAQVADNTMVITPLAVLQLGGIVTPSEVRSLSNVYVNGAMMLGDVAGTGAGLLMAVNGAGTNVAGQNLTIAGGASTNTAAPGSVVIQTTNTGAGASTLNTLYDRVTVASVDNATVTQLYDDVSVKTSTRYGSASTRQSLSEVVTITSPATTVTSTTNLLPANCYIWGVTANVTQASTNAVTWKMGPTGGADDLYAVTGQLRAKNTKTTTWNTGTTSPGGPTTALAPFINTAANTILVTAADPGATALKIRITVWYETMTGAVEP